MPGDRITIATVPDRATAELLQEVLRDGGIDDVELKSGVGMVYMPRPNAVEYDVRVQDVDEARARQVLADFEEQSGQAATSQATQGEAATVADEPATTLPRKRWVLWLAAAIVFVWLVPIVFSALVVVKNFVVGMFQ